eukprot:GHUV01004838.1.p1 GENE.GHUV01004838.1~~GHUV01004838.1.p1  ORF type:complete len:411 (+),score=62.29 GHUV01004838.1:225-1457(+)
MHCCLGRQINAVPGRQVRHHASARPLVGLAHGHSLACRRIAVATSNSHSQPALSINSEASAISEQLATQAEVAEVPAAVNSSSTSAILLQPVQEPVVAAAEEPQPQKGSNFISRVISGCILGFGGAAIVFAGKLPYLCAALFVVFHATQEFFGLLTSAGLSKGTQPPPPVVSVATTVLCLSITLFTYLAHGQSGAAMSFAAFLLLATNIFVNQKPTFAQLTSSVFGLFYCGYLPSFWIKLRNLNMAGPELQLPGMSSEVLSSICSFLPPLTVGLVATLTSVACIIAADTGAYFVGKNLGRTKLTDISPKKTVEGAVGGLASSIATAVLFWKLFSWPASSLAAAGYAVLTFTSSLFGDLIESIMKRDAGIKDSGNLIPGHGGLLDRFDSYMFSGALAYFYITYLMPRLGLV